MPALFASLLAADWKAVDRAFAIRCALGVSAGILIGYATGTPILAVACGMGAMSTGFASLQGFYRTRVATMLAMAFAMALSTLAGTLASHAIVAEIAALAVWGFAFGIVSALGAAASAVGLNATIALVIFSNFPLEPRLALTCALFVVIGGCIQAMLVVLTWPFQRYPEERHALAAAYNALASYAAAIDCEHPTLPPVAELSEVQQTLADPRPFGRRSAFNAFQTLLDEAQRIRATLGRIAATSCAAYPRNRDAIVAVLGTIAASLRDARPPDDTRRPLALDAEHDDEQMRALYGQLRAAWRNLAIPFAGRTLGTGALPAIEWFDTVESMAVLRANLSLRAPFGRHAVRLAVTLVVTGLLAHLLPLQRGYWMSLTAALVLRPDFTTTIARGVARIGGTLAGVILATGLVLALPDTPHVMLALAILFAALGYTAFQLNYAIYTITVTAYVVFILSLLGTPEQSAVVSRTIATLLGGGIAMVAYTMWPTWEGPQTRSNLLALVRADRAYARMLFVGLIDPERRDVKALATERSNVWSIRSQAETSLERMLGEPRANDDIPRDRALGLMAATARIGLGNLALATIYESPATAALPQLEPFARALETSFAVTEALLSGERAVGGTSLLRDAYAALASDPTIHRGLLATLDIMVDAANTMSELAHGGTTGT